MKRFILILPIFILLLISCKKDKIEIKEYSLVMMGDSRTYRTDWNETFGIENEIINVGFDSKKTGDVLCCQLPTALENPNSIVVLMVGFNDCDNEPYNLNTSLNNIKVICENLRDNNIEFIIQTNFSCTINYNQTIGNNLTADRVEELNDSIFELCIQNNYNLLDNRNSIMVDGIYLKDEYTTDGIHFNKQGYQIWSEALLKKIQEF